MQLFSEEKKLSIMLRACTNASNFCRYAIGFASKITKGFVQHLRIKISDSKAERRFDYSMSSLSRSKYIIELTIYKEKIV